MSSSRITYSSIESSGWVHCSAKFQYAPTSIAVTSKSMSALGVAERSGAGSSIIELTAMGAMLIASMRETRRNGDRLRMRTNSGDSKPCMKVRLTRSPPEGRKPMYLAV